MLIGSSLTMAMAVRGAQTNKRKATVNWLILTMILGAVFLGVKVIEYADKFEHHHVPGPNFVWAAEHGRHAAAGGRRRSDVRRARQPAGRAEHRKLSLSPEQLQNTTQIYFSLYFTMTGLHALHMIIGIGLMSVITWMAWKGKFDEQYYTPVEMSGLYWHFVDIVWIFLFPLLYLVERHTVMSSEHAHAFARRRSRFADLAVRHDFPGADGAHGGDRGRGVRQPRPVQLPGRDDHRRASRRRWSSGTSCT